MNSNKKTINRNAFNEKLIHRYFFETLYLDYFIERRKALVPDLLKSKISQLNLIVPEDTSYGNYRSDFTLYFKNEDKGYPVEIKWHSKDFNKENQRRVLVKNNGYLASFDSSINKSIPHVQLDTEHFRNWLTKRIDNLWDESLSVRVSKSFGKKTWIVVLRGEGALVNFHRMLELVKNKNKFWAFKNGKETMRNLLNVEVGDEMIFLFVKSIGNDGVKLAQKSKTNLKLLEVYHTKIEVPYYMVLEGNQSTFFEKGMHLPINKRIWPHFFDFKITQYSRYKNDVFLNRRLMGNDLRAKIVSSSNRGGILMPLTSVDTQELKGQLRLIDKKQSVTLR